MLLNALEARMKTPGCPVIQLDFAPSDEDWWLTREVETVRGTSAILHRLLPRVRALDARLLENGGAFRRYLQTSVRLSTLMIENLEIGRMDAPVIVEPLLRETPLKYRSSELEELSCYRCASKLPAIFFDKIQRQQGKGICWGCRLINEIGMAKTDIYGPCGRLSALAPWLNFSLGFEEILSQARNNKGPPGPDKTWDQHHDEYMERREVERLKAMGKLPEDYHYVPGMYWESLKRKPKSRSRTKRSRP